jgi:flagellin
MIINHNLSANFVNRQMQKAIDSWDKSVQKLSSGERINSAGDDASGLAVSERMRTQIKGLKQAEYNAQSGLSFSQVAESAMNQVSQVLQRIRELSIQSANGIYSDQDRQAIQVEVSQLVNEVDRISSQAEFNRLQLLTGKFAKNSRSGSMFFHVGPNKNQRIQAFISTMTSRALKLSDSTRKSISLSTVNKANDTIGVVDQALDKLNRQRADLGAQSNRMQITIQAIQSNYENMVRAESRIRDTDVAYEIINFTRSKILMQSSTAMLSQANLEPHLAIKLLE